MLNKKTIILGILFFILSMIFIYNQNIKILVVRSGSMEETINIGDILIIKKEKDYEIGNIVTYKTEDRYLITHRIIKKEKGGYITKGDNNNTSDKEIINFNQIQGKVFLNIGNIKKIILYVIIFILIYILYILYKSQRRRT